MYIKEESLKNYVNQKTGQNGYENMYCHGLCKLHYIWAPAWFLIKSSLFLFWTMIYASVSFLNKDLWLIQAVRRKTKYSFLSRQLDSGIYFYPLA
jgi:hypothetical protein